MRTTGLGWTSRRTVGVVALVLLTAGVVGAARLRTTPGTSAATKALVTRTGATEAVAANASTGGAPSELPPGIDGPKVVRTATLDLEVGQ